jgi:ABC-type Mn2+/Zn2+ transport system ATPase subunit
MQRAVIVRGRLKDSRTIILDEPVEGVAVDVEVVLREVPRRLEETGESVVAVVRRADFDSAMRKDIDVEVLRGSETAENSGEDVTESPFVARRVGATIPAGPPVNDETPPSGT